MLRIKRFPLLFTALLIICSFISKAPCPQAADNSRPIKVFLWFDTEDYILPEADEALLRISDFLTREGVKGTFKIVGEKARVLEQRGRADIIKSLENHEIGYHTNFHSVQPSPAMYLSDLDWAEGVREFNRREHQGFLDVMRITGQQPYCYGQPGASWAPQAFEALRQWGIRVYLDSIDIIDLDQRPFWYTGVLTLCSLEHEMRVGLGDRSDLETAKAQFAASREKILSERAPGVVSIYYHPCEFVHAQFWDGVNFSKGANPAPEDWKNPPMKSKGAIETGFANFEGFVRFIKSFPEVEFVTASQALEIFPDQSKLADFSGKDLDLLASDVLRDGVKYQVRGNVSLSSAEILYLLSRYAETELTDQRAPASWQLPERTISGPVSGFNQEQKVTSTLNQFRRTLRDVIDFMDFHSRVPDSVWLGSQQVSPESFLIATARFLGEGRTGQPGNGSIDFKPEALKTKSNVKENPSWGWVIFPDGFNAPKMMEEAREQTWSLKPAPGI